MKMYQKVVLLLCQVFVVLETRRDGRQEGRGKGGGHLHDYLGVSKPFFNPDTSPLVRVS